LASSPLSAQEVMMAGGGAKACDWWRPIEACQLTSGWDGKGMELSPDLTRYFLWAGIIAIGLYLRSLTGDGSDGPCSEYLWSPV
jgi:hypothetical protein